MTKILLVEKRYNGIKEKPLVTAEWVEIPNGEEELFLAKQTGENECLNEIENSNLQNRSLNETLNLNEIQARYVLIYFIGVSILFLLCSVAVYFYVDKTVGWR